MAAKVTILECNKLLWRVLPHCSQTAHAWCVSKHPNEITPIARAREIGDTCGSGADCCARTAKGAITRRVDLMCRHMRNKSSKARELCICLCGLAPRVIGAVYAGATPFGCRTGVVGLAERVECSWSCNRIARSWRSSLDPDSPVCVRSAERRTAGVGGRRSNECSSILDCASDVCDPVATSCQRTVGEWRSS